MEPNLNPSTTTIAIDNSDSGAKYTGLAMVTIGPPEKTFLYAADYAHNRVDIYDDSFKFVKSFSDENTPPGLRVFNVQAMEFRQSGCSPYMAATPAIRP